MEEIEGFNREQESIYANFFQEINQTQNEVFIDQETQSRDFSSKKDLHLKKFIDYLKCFICYEKVKDPVMCPSCSGFACK